MNEPNSRFDQVSTWVRMDAIWTLYIIYYMDAIWMLHGRYVDTSHHHPLSFGATSCMERLTESRVMSYAILYMDGAVIYRKLHQTVI